jgi:hypothetical protein
VQLSPFSRYFIPLRSKHSPEHPVLKHPQSVQNGILEDKILWIEWKHAFKMGYRFIFWVVVFLKQHARFAWETHYTQTTLFLRRYESFRFVGLPSASNFKRRDNEESLVYQTDMTPPQNKILKRTSSLQLPDTTVYTGLMELPAAPCSNAFNIALYNLKGTLLRCT